MNRPLAEIGRLSAKEIAHWLAYEQEYGPLDPHLRDDYRAAMVCAWMVNINLRKGAKPVSPTDLMPKFGEDARPRRQSMDEMKRVLKSITRAAKRRAERSDESNEDGNHRKHRHPVDRQV